MSFDLLIDRCHSVPDSRIHRLRTFTFCSLSENRGHHCLRKSATEQTLLLNKPIIRKHTFNRWWSNKLALNGFKVILHSAGNVYKTVFIYPSLVTGMQPPIAN